MAREAEVLGTEWFYDGSDSFAVSKEWLREFAETRSALASSGLSILSDLKVFAYANPADIRDEDVPGLLEACGVRRVFLGIESGDDGVLASMAKPRASTAANHRALGLLARSNLEVRIGIVLGVGETETSLANTYAFLQSLPNFEGLGLVSVVLSPVLVIPGSNLYRGVVAGTGNFDEDSLAEVRAIDRRLQDGQGITKKEINLLSRLYIESTTSLSYERLLHWKKRMDEILVAQNLGIWMFGGF